MDITFVTTNNGKAESLRRVFAPLEVSVRQVSMELPELQTTSLQEIAEHKARYAYPRIGDPAVVVQDAGFFLDAWDGFPGASVKLTLKTLGLDGLLVLVDGRSRHCAFKECLAYFDGTTPRLFETTIGGTLATEPRGEQQPDAPTILWRLFIPDGCNKTLAEMTSEEMAAWRRTRPKQYGDLFADWFCGPDGPGFKG